MNVKSIQQFPKQMVLISIFSTFDLTQNKTYEQIFYFIHLSVKQSVNHSYKLKFIIYT